MAAVGVFVRQFGLAKRGFDNSKDTGECLRPLTLVRLGTGLEAGAVASRTGRDFN